MQGEKDLEFAVSIKDNMSYHELFVSPSAIFGGYQKTFEEADYVVVGVPFDVTSTYRTGARFAPSAIREASWNIETYSFRAGIDVEELRIHDLGDLHVTSDVEETLRRLEQITKEMIAAKKIPVIIGGEHTITLGSSRAVDKSIAVLSFDAHLDLRNEYMNLTTSHTTFMRRINEQVHPSRIIEIGTRAVCKEELDYAKESGIQFITVQKIRRDNAEKTVDEVRRLLADAKRIYLTIDLDVLDLGCAPGVQNPEPEGLFTSEFFDILSGVCDQRVIAFDAVEVAPHYDHGVTAILAAKTIFEVLCHVEKARKTRL